MLNFIAFIAAAASLSSPDIPRGRGLVAPPRPPSRDAASPAATYKVGRESPRLFYPEFNPPSLRGLHAKRRFLHDGRARSLEDVLGKHHRPEKLTGKPLSKSQLDDLIAYLRSI